MDDADRALYAKAKQVVDFCDARHDQFHLGVDRLHLPHVASEPDSTPHPCFTTKYGDFSDMGQALLHHVCGPANRIVTRLDSRAVPSVSTADIAEELPETVQARTGYVQNLIRALEDPLYGMADKSGPLVVDLREAAVHLQELEAALRVWCAAKGIDPDRIRSQRTVG